MAAFVPQSWKWRLAAHGRLHLLAHVAAFFVALLLNTMGRRDRRAAIFAAILLILFGASLEWAQNLLYRHPFEYRDVLADATGVILGLFLRELIGCAEYIRDAAR